MAFPGVGVRPNCGILSRWWPPLAPDGSRLRKSGIPSASPPALPGRTCGTAPGAELAALAARVVLLPPLGVERRVVDQPVSRAKRERGIVSPAPLVVVVAASPPDGHLRAALPDQALLGRRLRDVLGVEVGERQLGIVDRDLADFLRRERAHVDVLLPGVGVVLALLALLGLGHHAQLLEAPGDLRVDLAPQRELLEVDDRVRFGAKKRFW
jgi:hypothetical protein